MHKLRIEHFLTATNYNIDEGNPYLWNCFGSGARIVDSVTDGSTAVNGYASCVYNPTTRQVFTVIAEDDDGNLLEWIDPDYIAAYNAEYSEKVKEDVEDGTPIASSLEDVMAVIRSKFDTETEELEINFEADSLQAAFTAAHKADVTLNEFVVAALRNYIAERENATD